MTTLKMSPECTNITEMTSKSQCRKLLSSGVRDPVRSSDGLLPHPSVHPVVPNCDHLVGLLLAEPRRHSSQGRSRRHHCAHDDYANGVNKCSPAKDLLRQVHRRVLGCLLLHGLRFSARYEPEGDLD